MKRHLAARVLFVTASFAYWLPTAAAQTDDLSANDRDYVEFAGQTDLVTVRLAQLAEMRASSAKLKQFASSLEKSHSADLTKLTAAAQKAGAVAPNTLDDVHKTAVKSLEKTKAKSFDHAFLKLLVNQHENALVSFKREADHGLNPHLQAYAKATLPQLETHLREAKALAGSAH